MGKIFMAGPSITDLELKLVGDAVQNGWYENAYSYVEKFEKEFAAYHNRKYALMTPNCTSAIHLLLMALGIKDEDEVIVPECTWIATAAPISYQRAKPVFCDIESTSWCLDPISVKKKLTSKTKAIIVVDLFGNMPNLGELEKIAQENGIPLIEDAAEALGSKLNGVRAGKFGVGSVFSFHRTKTLTTGEGGMLLLDDEKLFERCAFLRDHGRSKDIPYFNLEVAYKYMPSNIQAALGYAQFQRLDELVAIKRDIFHRYQQELLGVDDIQLNDEPTGVFNSSWVTGLVFGKTHQKSKEDAIRQLAALGVPARPFFFPLSSLPAYPHLEEANRRQNPVSYDISSRGINLPCAMNLTPDQIKTIGNAIRMILKK